MRYELPVQGPIDLALTFTCGQAFRWRLADGAWRGIVGGAEVSARLLRPTLLSLEVVGADPGREALARYFRLDENPLRHLEHAEELRRLPGILPLFGLRLLRQDPWETLASFLCSAAANIGKITACVEGMSARWGEPIPGAGRRRFPDAERLARARVADLRALGLGFRAPYLRETARRVASSRWSWEALRGEPYERARERLMDLPGVGTKIADCALLFGLGRLEAYPVDRWIRRATMELASRRKAKDEELSRWAERFGPGRGYLQQILFHLRRTGGPLPALSRTGARKRTTAGSELPALAIFAKAPVPGRVKTRLVPPLTRVQAARVARAALEDTLRRFVPETPGRWTLYLDGDPDAALRALAKKLGIGIRPQSGAALGERLGVAFRELREGGASRVIAIGSDSPSLNPVVLRDASSALKECDVVLGPAEDGGYYLVGMSGSHEALFEGIPWSTERALERTLERVRELKLSARLLAPWYDLDDLPALRRAYRELRGNRGRGPGGGGARDDSALRGVLEGLKRRLGLDQ